MAYFSENDINEAKKRVSDMQKRARSLTNDSEKEKKQHIKAAERGIRKQYEPTVRKISKTQGRLLVKLIDRECGQTSFEMIKAFVGTAKANMYNVLSSLFGNNLRKHYDPEGDDRDIERIVRMVESGQL